jgi:uncharacterized membrane protein YgcG
LVPVVGRVAQDLVCREVIHHVLKEINSSKTFPMLTKTNYHDWVVLIWVMLQAYC